MNLYARLFVCMSTNPFEFVNSINANKDIMLDDVCEKEYVPFVVNRAFSYFNDTIFISNQANMMSHMDNKIQYSFLINSIRSRKRFSKWSKKTNNADLELVKLHYNYNNQKAETALSLLTKTQLDCIRKCNNRGG